MKDLAKIIGMTENELQDFYMSYVKKSMAMGFSEVDAKKIVQETFRKQLGLL